MVAQQALHAQFHLGDKVKVYNERCANPADKNVTVSIVYISPYFAVVYNGLYRWCVDWADLAGQTK